MHHPHPDKPGARHACATRSLRDQNDNECDNLCILYTATRSPSGVNAQPGEIFVASGSTWERIRAAYIERAQAGPANPPGLASAPAAPPQPPAQPAYIRERMETIRSERMKLLELDPADPASGKVLMEWGARLFGAPVVVVLCMDQALSAAFDLRLLAQTICLAAQGFGVDSLIAAAFIRHNSMVLQRRLGLLDQ